MRGGGVEVGWRGLFRNEEEEVKGRDEKVRDEGRSGGGDMGRGAARKCATAAIVEGSE